MINTSFAGIDSSMDEAFIENEPQEDIDLDEDDFDEEEDEIIIQDEPIEFDIDDEDGEIPAEVAKYMDSLGAQTQQLEKELEECDELIYHSSRPFTGQTNAIIAFDDNRELEAAAAEQGLTVDELKQKLLKDAEDESFTEEDVDKEYEEFLQLQQELELIRAGTEDIAKDKGFQLEKETLLAIQGPDVDDRNEGSETFLTDDNNSAVTEKSCDTKVSESGEESRALVPVTVMSNMRDFILQQLRMSEQSHQARKKKLLENMEVHRLLEEKRSTHEEENRREFHRMLEEEEIKLRVKKEELERKTEEEIREMDEATVISLNLQQEEIDRWAEALEEERRQFESFQKEVTAKEDARQKKAATEIQRMFRGFRTRKQMSSQIKELDEWREARKKSIYDFRIMEVEYEIKNRDEQAKKEKEERERKERDEQMCKQEEEKRKKKEEEEKRIEEERKKKEIEDKKKEDERIQKEEQQCQKEEEKQRKEEERLKKEEEKKRKAEEEKQRKEEDRLKKEEEKKQKAEEKKRQKEEEKQRKEQEKLKKEEEKKRKAELEEKSKTCEKKNQDDILLSREEDMKENNTQITADEGQQVADIKNENEDKLLIAPPNPESIKSDNEINKKVSTNGDALSTASVQMVPPDSESITSEKEINNTISINADALSTASAQMTNDTNSKPVLNRNLKESGASSPALKFIPHPPSRPPSAGSQRPNTPSAVSSKTNSDVKPIPSSTNQPEKSSSRITSASTGNLVKSAEAKTTQLLVESSTDATQIFQQPSEPPKPDPVEVQRLTWMKKCIPWSKVSNEPWLLNSTSQKTHKKPTSAKKLPAVSEAVVLSAAQAETLRQVSCVKLTDLPGCSLSTLNQCWSLRYLTVTHCGLICLDGLSQCKHLHYINAEHNSIEYMDLKDLGSLQVLRLAHNNVNVIHGLDGCINLRWLDLSHNHISKLAGLGALRRLHTLRLAHNQLVNSEGLDKVVTLQELDLSHNYLQKLVGLGKLCLLTNVDVSSNNLQQIPELHNQVLLQCIHLQGNSLKSLADFSNFWLPLLHSLNCSQNMLENLTGLDKLIMLSRLDASSNQITEPEVVTTDLKCTNKLTNLLLDGNPLVDVYTDDYRDMIFKCLTSVKCIDDVARPEAVTLTPEQKDSELKLMYLSQIEAHKKLANNLFTQIQKYNDNSGDNLCACYFNFCDLSFKIASEQRSAHEYGDVSVTRSISDFTAPTSATLPKENDSSVFYTAKAGETDKKSMFEAALASSVQPSSSEQFLDSVHVADTENKRRLSVNSSKSHDVQSKTRVSSSVKCVSEKVKNLSDVQAGHIPILNTSGKKKVDDSSDSSDLDSDEEIVSNILKHTTSAIQEKLSSEITTKPTALSYMNEKDKFELALHGGQSASESDNHVRGNNSRDSHNNNLCHDSLPFGLRNSDYYSPGGGAGQQNSTSVMRQKYLLEQGLQDEPAQVAAPSGSAKAMFEAALSGADSRGNTVGKQQMTKTMSTPNMNFNSGVRADVVGNKIVTTSEDDMPDDVDFDMYGDLPFDDLEFDIDKYLDMDGLDEYLEKGWRPADSPQIPQSSYPVLGKIGSTDENANNNYNNMMNYGRNTSKNGSLGNTGYGPTPPPPNNPSFAWKDGPVTELRGMPPRPSPLPIPSPSPSTVASAAETMGGGSIRSKKDELSDEWGFKDNRTAELMMARAKKMKYNAERKKKINKLDPQQRYQLFRKLEESGKLQHVKPPPAKVLPRKEYFQAREEEVQRHEVERQVEEKTRVHRTYEWIHTQVGDHPISTSRINPGPHGASYSNTSPTSDHLDSVSSIGSHKGRLGRRFSTGEYSGHTNTPTLPPIKNGSAPSTQKNERISRRDEPVEQSGGWGGGKKRNKNR